MVLEAKNSNIILVTGGNRGIGLATLKTLAENDNNTLISTYNSTLPTDNIFDRTNVEAIKCDITSGEELDSLFLKVKEDFGDPLTLICCAGITKDALILRHKDSDFEKVINSNLNAVYMTVRRAIPAMIKARFGRIVLVSSVVGFMGSPGQISYAASKSAMLGMARSIVRELSSRNITANVVAPGAIDTDMLKSAGDKRIQEMTTLIPLGRIGEAQEVADTICFLVSEKASYINGAVITVDGGLGMGY
jgi:3-oxoacyl-[acyl-carrier protein] reductase